VDYEVVLEQASARQLAAVRGTSPSASELGPVIIRLLDQVWPLLRTQGTPTGHNVVVYYGGPTTIAAGVEIFGPIEPTAQVEALSTPAGEVVRTTHWGEYSAMRPAYVALDAWFATHDRAPAGVSWEVYGDWAESAADRRTDIYFLVRPA
jgi:effector-binding domain-containing protein